jgi:hypothetical protein
MTKQSIKEGKNHEEKADELEKLCSFASFCFFCGSLLQKKKKRKATCANLGSILDPQVSLNWMVRGLPQLGSNQPNEIGLIVWLSINYITPTRIY